MHARVGFGVRPRHDDGRGSMSSSRHCSVHHHAGMTWLSCRCRRLDDEVYVVKGRAEPIAGPSIHLPPDMSCTPNVTRCVHAQYYYYHVPSGRLQQGLWRASSVQTYQKRITQRSSATLLTSVAATALASHPCRLERYTSSSPWTCDIV